MGQKRFGEQYKDFDRIDFDEKPAHKVSITQPFLMGVTEVTVAQYRQFDSDFKTGDPKSKPADDDAARGVTWEKAVAFCEWLSKKEGKPYRLPTEAEWEYACRAGTTTLFNTGDTLPDGHQKWFGEDNFRGVYFPPGPMPREYDWRTVGKPSVSGLKQGEIIGLVHPEEESRAGGAGELRVAQKTPNAWGLHDMHGNLAEWCLDWYGPYESGAQTDPIGRADGDYRVFRGGFSSSMIRFLRSANRGSWVPNSVSDRIGFRVVQADLPKGKPLPMAPAPLNAQKVSQTVPRITPQPADAPFWDAQDVNDHAPKIWWDGDRTLFHFVEARGHGDNLVRRSTDNGVTWSKAEVLRPRGESSGNPIRTKDGVIAMPYDNSSLVISRDNGKTWQSRGRDLRGNDGVRPGNSGPCIAGIHAPIVELADGRLMAFGRLHPADPTQKLFNLKMPASYSSDLGETWHWEVSEFPVVSNVQRPALYRLKEGPIVLCSFTDQHRTPFKDRKGLTFKSAGGDYTGYGLFAAVSYDEGKTWPDRRLLAPEGKSVADSSGYLAMTQSHDGNIQVITSKDHYVFNLAWIKALPTGPKK